MFADPTTRTVLGRTRKSERLDMRVSPEERTLFEEAAAASGCSLADFLRASAVTAAQALLADRTQFVLPAERWAAFSAAIDREPRDLPRLAAFLARPPVVDQPR